MKTILFNKIILSIFFFIAGTAIAWTQGFVKFNTEPDWQPRSTIVAKANVKKVTETQRWPGLTK